MFEYIENDAGSWRYKRLPDIPQDFHDELARIGGLNRFGGPNLRVVKGNEALSDRATHRGLKYLAGWSPQDVKGYRYQIDGEWQFAENIDGLDPSIMVVPAIDRQPLGVLRYVIEKWVSPEELGRQGRFSKQYAEGDIAPTLRQRPEMGIYDCYLIVETLEGKFRKLDSDVLKFIERQWHYDQLPENKRLQDEQRAEDHEKEQREKRNEEIWDAAASFDIRLSPEEREYRDEFWAKYDRFGEDVQQYAGTAY